MSAPAKLATRLQYTGDFQQEQAQRLAQQSAQKVNSHAEMLSALQNRSYVALATDFTQAATATYATLLTATITTVLESGFLIVTWSASGQQITNPSVDWFQITVDGEATKGCYQSTIVNGVFSAGMVLRVAVTRGSHTVRLQTKVSNNSLTIHAATVNEAHANLLVQEAA